MSFETLMDSAEHNFRQTLHRATLLPVMGLMVFALVLLVIVGYLVWTLSWVDHTNRVIAQALTVEKQMLNMQSAARGFFLTAGDATFLTPYDEARPDIDEELQALVDMVGDNPRQAARAGEVERTAHAWLTEVDRAVANRNTARPPPTTRQLEGGSHLFDEFRNASDQMLGSEYALRDERTAHVIRSSLWSLAVAVGVALLLGGWQAFNTRRGLRESIGRFRDLVQLAERRNQQVKQVVVELDRELKAVAEIQQSLLPIRLPQIPTIATAASYETSQRAGGDYYDFFRLPPGADVPLDDQRWGILIADVSGHGTPAAVLMAVTHAIAHGIERPLDSPSHLLDFVNRRLCKGYTTGVSAFVTAFFGIYDPNDRTLTYSSAGHNPPRVFRSTTGKTELLDQAQSMPLGVDLDETFLDTRITLNVGDTLVLYTDGWIEARDAHDVEQFGYGRLEEIFRDAHEHTPDELIARARNRLRDHVGEHLADDDRTLLVLRVTDDDPDQPSVVQTAITADTSLLAAVEAATDEEEPDEETTRALLERAE